ncbi:hypothetical protein [Methyloligella solikamskensis]|uniref:Uncharacterized protein n=1 Tax=Methyloligella solikamskensis TaxID=1177756 RepID=A0ABW3JB47_9HYPH
MAEGQARPATGSPGGGGQEDYAKIETALQKTPRGRWFLAEYARRNRNADTALVLTAMERLERVVKGSAGAGPVSPPETAQAKTSLAEAFPLARMKQDAEIAVQDIAAMEQASKDAATDILLATEAIQDFSWEMRDKGIDRKTCETIERHTADIYAACSFQDVVYQRKENALHLLRLMAETLEAALGAGRRSARQSAAPSTAPETSFEGAPPVDVAPALDASAPELEIPISAEFVADETGSVGGAEHHAPAPAEATQPSEPETAAPSRPQTPEARPAPQRPAAKGTGGPSPVDTALSRLDDTRLAVLFG